MANTKPAAVKTGAKETKEEIKKIVKIEDSTLVKVKSTTFGVLFYKNLRTGESTEWECYGDVQIMSIGDLRAMKNSQVSFFKDHRILILGLADGEDCNATVPEILDALLITKYYQNCIDPEDLREVCTWSESEIAEKVPMMGVGVQENLVVSLNSFIKDGLLDSVRKIKAFEKALGQELLSIED